MSLINSKMIAKYDISSTAPKSGQPSFKHTYSSQSVTNVIWFHNNCVSNIYISIKKLAVINDPREKLSVSKSCQGKM